MIIIYTKVLVALSLCCKTLYCFACWLRNWHQQKNYPTFHLLEKPIRKKKLGVKDMWYRKAIFFTLFVLLQNWRIFFHKNNTNLCKFNQEIQIFDQHFHVSCGSWVMAKNMSKRKCLTFSPSPKKTRQWSKTDNHHDNSWNLDPLYYYILFDPLYYYILYLQFFFTYLTSLVLSIYYLKHS